MHTKIHQDGVLLWGELLQQVVVGGVGGKLALGQTMPQTMLMAEEQPHLSTSAFGNSCTQR